jgi:hypothetical protein
MGVSSQAGSRPALLCCRDWQMIKGDAITNPADFRDPARPRLRE